MNVEELDVFKISHNLTLEIYKITEKFPEIERFGLISQMRKSSSSICSNLIEGAYREGRKELIYFTNISMGSCGELKYQLFLAKDLNYISEEEYNNLVEKVKRIILMLSALKKSLKSSNKIK